MNHTIGSLRQATRLCSIMADKRAFDPLSDEALAKPGTGSDCQSDRRLKAVVVRNRRSIVSRKESGIQIRRLRVDQDGRILRHPAGKRGKAHERKRP